MYIAEQVDPPSYSSAAQVTSNGSSVGGTLVDMRDAMNWEASGHASNFSGYFYYVVTSVNLTQSTLHSDIVGDIAGYSKPVLVITKTSGLSPNCSNGTVLHAISVIGYEGTAGGQSTTLYIGIHADSNGGIVY